MVNTILLSVDGYYVDNDGNLPERPSYDKELLTAFCKNAVVSQKSYDIVPPSMQKYLKISKDPKEINVAFSIPEINELSDVLIVIRSQKKLKDGKKFRFDNFKLLTIQGNIEIWIKK